MLSPASRRICCLAVMAPALSKADKQINCFLVVYFKSHCISKSLDTYNWEDGMSEIHLKCTYSSEYVPNKSKPFMHRVYIWTKNNRSEFSDKYSFDSPNSFLCSDGLSTCRNTGIKLCPNTNAAHAYKIKVKYTMIKNALISKNMVLGKVNLSLGLRNLKNVKKLSKENHKSDIDVMEGSLNFSDSNAHIGPLISDLAVNSKSVVFRDDAATIMSSSLFSQLTCSKLQKNAYRLSVPTKVEAKIPVLTDNRFGLNYSYPVRKGKNMCCILSNKELESVVLMLDKLSARIRAVLAKSNLFLQKQMNINVKKQISCLVEYYQRRYQIPCQRTVKHVNTKSGKHLLDVKAKCLQNEDVKKVPTSAFLSVAQKIGSIGSQELFVSPKITSCISESGESVTLNSDQDDSEEIKYTNGIILTSLKNLLKMSDPYFTDSSEEESTSETEEEDEVESNETAINKSALWKYMTQRSALASSSTWLLARHHELEYCIKEYEKQWNELIKAEGLVCLEEVATPQSSLLSVESGHTNLEDSNQQASVKGFLAMNGFLDPNCASHIARTSVSGSFLSEIESSLRTEYGKEREGHCCRTKPLDISSFRKRKLFFTFGLHASNPKFLRLSTVSCYCNSQNKMAPCILCTGQYSGSQSVDPHSMAVRDRIAILDPYFHPVLSSEKDIPVCLPFENYLKIESKYHNIQSVPLLETNVECKEFQPVKSKFSDIRSRRKLSHYTKSLSAKYRHKHYRNSRHLRKHKLVFGKWRHLKNKYAVRVQTPFRKHRFASSGSDLDSPVYSSIPIFDDGYEDKRPDKKFDIDDVIIPYNSRRGRLINLQYKEIITPSWQSVSNEDLTLQLAEELETNLSEDITEPSLMRKHALLEVEEKERMKQNALGLSRRRRNRCESMADRSGANTPDHTSSFSQDSMFQVPYFTASTAFPASPSTPKSVTISEDSRTSCENASDVPNEQRKLCSQKQSCEESHDDFSVVDYEEVSPFDPFHFPLSDEVYEALLAESDHDQKEFDLLSFSPNYSASPVCSSSSTSTVEEGEDAIDDVTDPEWTVVKPVRSGPNQALVLKFARK